MSDSKLKCKLCDFECGNLAPHIEKEHPEITVEAYAEKYGGLDSIVHPDLQKQYLKDETVIDEKGMIRISGVDIAHHKCRQDLKRYIPKKADTYAFQDFTSDVIMDLQCKPPKPVLLIGHTGTGKTSLFFQLAARIGQPLILANMNHQTTIADFTGTWVVKGGNMEWVDGILPYCMRHGIWLVIDELDFADAAILSVLNSVLEPGGCLTLKEKGHEIVEPHKDFRVVATANAVGVMAEYRGLYQGTNIMNEAFLDRWKCYVVDYLDEATEAKVLAGSVSRMSDKVARELVKVATMVRKAFAEENVASTFSTRRLMDWAEMIVRHRDKKKHAPLKAAESTIFSKVSREDKIAIEGIMKRVLFGQERS